ncbi:acetolactate decarboxylase [Legionella worsleiensis]|uniref:Alpha-acetolactate decarboxylase n=1 Tax=Legionella worsleiensis TaxID=45076 RepID=A0A0W1A6C2_9GAMM|nr:acetolactate decarboxylase [Legionella worsleiensis]KTD76852.1 Alpha-acetolactate decarboxylase [Legionella worsleiensis]STY30735.1 Alpha-acetolactate decarboxylase precursor [Legionella worsleiensis]
MSCSNNTLFQTGTLCGFIDKVYDGDCTLKTLSEKGTLGIGTFNGVHGELIGIDGQFYRIIEDGMARPVDPQEKTPFAWVVPFEETQQFQLDDIENLTHFAEEFDKHIPSQNYIYAYRFACVLDEIQCRSEACQPQPYQPLMQTLPELQVNFTYQQIKGVFAGFRFPDYFAALNVPGHHLHFLNPDEMKGGHVFELKFKSAKIKVCMIKKYELALIESEAFSQFKMHGEELHSATKAIEQQK